MKIETTFAKLHDAEACKDRYRHLAKSLGGIRKYGRTKPITLLQILDSNGLDDALWALRCCDTDSDGERLLHEWACWCAEQVLPMFEGRYPDDKRPRRAIETKRRWLDGNASDEELNAACAAAGAAAYAAARAASVAASAAARDAAYAAMEKQTQKLREMLHAQEGKDDEN